MADSNDAKCLAEVSELFERMSTDQRRALLYLGCKYLERQRAPGPEISAEIARVESEICQGLVPSVPDPA